MSCCRVFEIAISRSRALWDSCYFYYSIRSKEVKQCVCGGGGGGWGYLHCYLRSALFYKLLCKLKGSGLDCRMGNTFVEALSYADDITLLWLILRGLNRMEIVYF